MGTVPAHRVKKGDTVTIPTTITGKVIRRMPPSPSGAVRIQLDSNLGVVWVTTPADSPIQVTGITIQENE